MELPQKFTFKAAGPGLPAIAIITVDQLATPFLGN